MGALRPVGPGDFDSFKAIDFLVEEMQMKLITGVGGGFQYFLFSPRKFGK